VLVGFLWLFLKRQRGVESSMAGRGIEMEMRWSLTWLSVSGIISQR